jgi:pimeloyl-ACP methyl ester carboxylesterase
VPNKYVQVDARGTRIATYVHHAGPTTLPEQPPGLAQGEVVLCLHGEGGNGHLFAGLIDGLAAAHSPIAFDQPGHGRSAGLDSLGSIDAMAGFTRTFAAGLGLRPAVLLGHSMGALVALQCALDEPEQVRALVLCAPGAGLAHSEADLEQATRVSHGKQRRAFDPGLWAKGTSPDLMRAGFFEDMKTDPRARLGDLQACRDWRGLERLADLRVPCLLLEGAAERPAARDAADEIAARLGDGRRERVAGAGHMLPLEAPVAVAALVSAFLGDLP